MIRLLLPGAAILLSACSADPTDVPPLPPESAESANTLMTEAERAATAAQGRSEPKALPTGSNTTSNEVTP